MVARGKSYISDVKDEELLEGAQSGLVFAATSLETVAELDVVVIWVPTPLSINLNPDVRYIESVTREISRNPRPGQVISLESTTYPGTTEEVMKPIFSRKAGCYEADLDKVNHLRQLDATRPANELVAVVTRWLAEL
jgi:UDP-N-acetyl-D-glucosamine dehydrogenase